jgi:hypothetical protein
MAGIHAEWLAARFVIEKNELTLMIKNQCRCKRAMRHLRGREASKMQSEIDKRAERIAKGMNFIKRG